MQSVIVRPAVSGARSEGELSRSEVEEDQGFPPLRDSGMAAVGPSPWQPGECVCSLSICFLLLDLLGQGSRGAPVMGKLVVAGGNGTPAKQAVDAVSDNEVG